MPKLIPARSTPIGVAVPGIIREGVVEDSPNLTQIKGMRLAHDLQNELSARAITTPVHIANDADAIAAGVAPLTAALRNSLASGPSATALATAAGPMSKAFGNADTSPSPSTPKNTAVVPIHIDGTREDPKFGVDFNRMKHSSPATPGARP